MSQSMPTAPKNPQSVDAVLEALNISTSEINSAAEANLQCADAYGDIGHEAAGGSGQVVRPLVMIAHDVGVIY